MKYLRYLLILIFTTLFVMTNYDTVLASSRDDYPKGSMKGSDFSEFDEGPMHDMFGGPQKGQEAPDFTLTTIDGKIISLSSYIGKKPVVLEFGSYTCPVFREKNPSMEKLHSKYGNDAAFFIIYVTEAHPSGDPSPYTGKEWVTAPNKSKGILYRQPVNMSQRTDLAKDAQSNLNIQIPIIIDNMNNSAWKAYGKTPNAAYIIGTDGQIKLRQGWFNPSQFEKVLIAELKKR